MGDKIDINRHRKTQYPIESVILSRWSPRSMNGEPITEDQIMPLFEASRWAPSAFNNQPWRYCYALRGDQNWDRFFDCLVEFNQGWCKNAGALILVCSHKFFEHNGKPTRTHAYDTGSATQNLLLQASQAGLVGHPMEGFDYDQARKNMNVPEEMDIQCMIAIGHPASPDALPEELREKEKPSERQPMSERVFKGSFAK